MFAIMSNVVANVNIMSRAWPFEILLTAALMGFLLWATSATGMFIPGIIILGNGILLSYTSLTGRWQDWAFLSLLEPIIIFIGIYIHIYLTNHPELAPRWNRIGGIALAFGSIALSAWVCITAFFILH